MKTACAFLALTFLCLILVAAQQGPLHAGAVAAPVLKWQHGGCYSSWCETGWYSSPAVADVDGDGAPEVIGAAYSLFVLNGEDGTVQWSTDPAGGRVWPGVVLADLNGDGQLEIATGHGSGYLHVHNGAGDLLWSRRPADGELRGLSAFDLEGDGFLELIATAATGSATNTWVLQYDGSLRPGWPQLSNDSGYAWGVYNDNATIGDMDGDGAAEIVVPSDVHYINAYERNGAQIAAHSMYGDKGWGKVGVHVDHDVDLRGYAHCGVEHRPNFAHAPAAMVDVDGNGSLEVVATGNVYNCGTSPYTSLYEMPFIFNADRSRWAASGYDWEVIPTPDGAAGPLSEDYNEIESAMPNPVIADLDGDGEREVLFASYDGRLHAYWLDKTQRHNWPYVLHGSGPGIRFASEPVVADLDGNGQAEVLFASWPEKGSGQRGKLHILDYQGAPIHEIELPEAFGGATWNGALAAPTLANIDADPDVELVLNTAHSGFVAYDLPGTAQARLLWSTARGSYQRSGSLLYGSLLGSTMSMGPPAASAGETVTVTIILHNPGPDLADASLHNTLPAVLTFAGGLSASGGVANYSAGTVTWSGAVPALVPVTISYQATLETTPGAPTLILNEATVDDGHGTATSLVAHYMANGLLTYLPAVRSSP